jgi:hypothetical protein
MRGQESVVRPLSPSPSPELLKTALRVLSSILKGNSSAESTALTLDFDEFRQAVSCERSSLPFVALYCATGFAPWALEQKAMVLIVQY